MLAEDFTIVYSIWFRLLGPTFMLANTRFLKIILIMSSTILLSQCVKGSEPQNPSAVKNEQPKAVVSPYAKPANNYLGLSKNKPDNEKQQLLLMAASRFIDEGQWRDGIRLLAQLKNLTPFQANTKTILLAKTEMIRDQPRAAISRLSGVEDLNSLPIFYQVNYYETLASAYESVARYAESVVERIKLAQLIPDEPSRIKNSQILWITLTKLSKEELKNLAFQAPDNTDLQGWTGLALLAKQKKSDYQEMFTQVEQWQTNYPTHSANQLLPSPLASIKTQLHASPRQIALLLPLSGVLSGPGGAVRDGFMAAANNSKTQVRLYNTAGGEVAALYQQAISDGADYVVGPLTKSEVAVIAALEHPVPTLLLNDIDIESTPNAYHFGLSPSHEARQIALKASSKGHKHALIIAPEGNWGDEIVSAFSTQWRENGGIIVDKLAYSNNQDLNVALRDVLHISDSLMREKQLKQLLGDNIQTIPSRRQDFDMIFLLAYPSKARQIMPLLKYYFAGNVPVYATSTVYAGSPDIMKDKDLEGLIFSDMPWVFSHQMGNKNWPEQFNSYNRLYALGVDSFNLSTQLNQLLLFPAMGIDETSGILYIKQGRQIARIPAWGQFKRGIAVAMRTA